MSHSWAIERRRIIALIAAIIILGLLSGYWIISIILPSTIYIGWQLRQFYKLEQWLLAGFKPRKAPDSSGVWESIISQILKIRKRDKLLQKRLAKMAKGYRNTIKALPDAVVVVNDELEIEWSNAIAEQYLGINSKRDFGYRITNLIRIPEFYEYLTNPTAKALEFEAPDIPGMILSLRVIHYGQNQRLILGRDISERVQIRNTLKAFISNASHELRTPLTVISGYVELIQDDPELPAHLRAPLYQLREQTDHMTQLIKDLLTLSQLEGDTLADYEGQRIDLPAILAQHIHTIQQSGMVKNHSIALDTDGQLGLLGIEREVISIYTNLIENALKYTPAGSLINIRWDINNEGQPCLTVKDNGPGFGSEHIPQLSQRFYRVHNAASIQTEGTGLGLAIVKHAVIHHGGSLSIDSAPNAGAEFSACFPVSRIYRKPKPNNS